MAYITFDDKIKQLYGRGKRKINLPLEILHKISNNLSLVYSTDISSLPEEDRNDDYLLKNASSFYIRLTKDKHGDLKRSYYLTLGNSKKEFLLFLDDLDIWNANRTEMFQRKYFHEFKPGDLAITAHPEVYLLKDITDVFLSGFQNTEWDLVVPEGTLLTLLEKTQVQNLYFIKVFYKNCIYWAFGALFDAKHDNSTDSKNNHHFI